MNNEQYFQRDNYRPNGNLPRQSSMTSRTKSNASNSGIIRNGLSVQVFVFQSFHFYGSMMHFFNVGT